MHQKRQLVVMYWLIVLFPGIAGAQTAPSAGWRETGIMPGDVVRLEIWREPELSFETTVPNDGTVVFHKLGPYDVRGLDAEELRETLVREYSRYLVDAERRIRLEVMRKVQISGAVRNPSIYTLHPTMSLSDALAMAGGALADGRADRMELRRDGELIRLLLTDDRTPLADSPIRSGDQLHVPQRSAASRNLGIIASVLTSIFVVTISVLAR
jgi:protein involved in polysaccharide export with SLBB domain